MDSFDSLPYLPLTSSNSSEIDAQWFDQVRIPYTILNSLSLVCCCFMLLTYILFRWNLFEARISFWLTLSIFFLTLSQLLSSFWNFSYLSDPDDIRCKIQGAGVQFSAFSLILWLLCMSLNLYFTTWKMLDHPKRLELFYFVFSFGGGLITTIIGLIGGYFEPAGPLWCWIDSNRSVAEFALLYISMIFCAILIIILWSLVIYKIRQLVSFQRERSPLLSGSTKLSPILFRHIVLLFLFMVIFCAAFIQRAVSSFTESEYNENKPGILMLIHAMVVSALGLLIFFPLACKKSNFTAWKILFSRIFCPRRSSQFQTNSESEDSRN